MREILVRPTDWKAVVNDIRLYVAPFYSLLLRSPPKSEAGTTGPMPSHQQKVSLQTTKELAAHARRL